VSVEAVLRTVVADVDDCLPEMRGNVHYVDVGKSRRPQCQKPVVTRVSQATRPKGSSARIEVEDRVRDLVGELVDDPR